jgi:hypothetical protein
MSVPLGILVHSCDLKLDRFGISSVCAEGTPKNPLPDALG